LIVLELSGAAGSGFERGRSVIGSVYIGWVLFPGRVAGLFEMVCELFFSICTSFPNGAHLLRGEVLNADVVSDVACPSGPARGRTTTGIFAHIRMLSRRTPQ
jgi:hypothetical protein